MVHAGRKEARGNASEATLISWGARGKKCGPAKPRKELLFQKHSSKKAMKSVLSLAIFCTPAPSQLGIDNLPRAYSSQ